MTKEEKRAALDAINALLGQEQSNPTGPQLPPEYAAAWNKIMQKFDDDTIPDADLLDMLTKIANGDLTSLD